MMLASSPCFLVISVSLREISSPRYSTCGFSLRVATSPQLKASSLSRNICLAVSCVCKRHLFCSCSNVKLCTVLVCVSIDSTSLEIAHLLESSSETHQLMIRDITCFEYETILLDISVFRIFMKNYVEHLTIPIHTKAVSENNPSETDASSSISKLKSPETYFRYKE
ncbi:hypothetical protein AVEN_199073-1 [Araneus ventricosus]|uniref:Uncharacterized protein n=1 Tax=Araneus ventricosus TaxID=182803 RepID=A0A4Y2N115_ARAVE|nr:hypothetical protein AVEN_199073-1 [Araneus ventricosus]